MPLDGVLLRGLVSELSLALTGGRIEKVQQPERDELLLTIRSLGRTCRLLLSCSSNHPRLHITQETRQNPQDAPMFCMMLRRRLVGSRLIAITQPGLERVVRLDFEGADELGDITRKSLVIEIMARHSNIMFLNAEDRILDAIKRVDEEISRVRQILPGLLYTPPPNQDKRDGLTETIDGIWSNIESSNPCRIDRWLSDHYAGIALRTAQEICFRTFGTYEMDVLTLTQAQKLAFCREIEQLFTTCRNEDFAAHIYCDEQHRPLDVLPFPYSQFPSAFQQPMKSISDALEIFHHQRDQQERLTAKGAHLNRVLNQNLDRCRRKQAAQESTLADAAQGERYRLMGDLVTANLHALTRGQEKAQLPNYYEMDDEGRMPLVEVALDARLDPVGNAQRLYKRYQKAKTARHMATQQLADTLKELEYIESLCLSLSQATDDADLSAIRDELQLAGYIKAAEREKKRTVKSQPLSYRTSDGFAILAGKHNVQNDQLTLRTARPDDLWFHTKNIHGSHVILRLEGVAASDIAIQEAALIAAWHSQARASGQVPVDYTQVRYVKKPVGSKPGMVIYTQQHTVYVTPDEQSVTRLRG